MSIEENEVIPTTSALQTPMEKNNPRLGSIQFTRSQQLSYSSPIPPPEVLAGYNVLVSPDAGDRLLKMVERQEAHRQDIEKTVIKGDNIRAYIGQFSGVLILLATMGLTAYLANLGLGGWGIALIIGELMGLAGVFFYSSKNREKEREHRAELMTRHQKSIEENAPQSPQEEENPSI